MVAPVNVGISDARETDVPFLCFVLFPTDFLEENVSQELRNIFMFGTSDFVGSSLFSSQ
jgi:hypothetical protein